MDLVVPVRNEQAVLPDLFAALDDLKRRPEASALRHIIVADNGSTDRSAELAHAAGAIVVHEPRPGYGAACLAALGWIDEQARGGAEPPGAVAFLDADLSDDPLHLPRLWGPVLADEADLALGQRAALAEPGALEPHQRFGNALACALIALTTGRRYRDLGPMRVVGWSALESLAMADRTWGWTVEMQYKAATGGLRVLELDVPYRRRRAGRSKISGSIVGSARAGWVIVTKIAALWWAGRDEVT